VSAVDLEVFRGFGQLDVVEIRESRGQVGKEGVLDGGLVGVELVDLGGLSGILGADGL
jgi:hypothetical protein